MDDLEFIKGFSKISVTAICKKLKINRGNLLNNRTTKENEKRVRTEIEKEIRDLYRNQEYRKEM